ILTQADSIAWTFNIRGADISHNPAPLAFALLRAEDGSSLFIDGPKVSNSVRAALGELTEIRAPAALGNVVASLGQSTAQVMLDPQTTAEAIRLALADAGGSVVEGQDPVLIPKARKNAIELAGTRAAHVRDGAAMVRFLAWLDGVPAGTIDEIEA